MRYTALIVFPLLVFTGCESKSHKVERLQAQYNAAYPAYAKACLYTDDAGAARLLTGQKLTAEQTAALEAQKKAQEAACKPQGDHLAEIQREILAEQR